MKKIEFSSRRFSKNLLMEKNIIFFTNRTPMWHVSVYTAKSVYIGIFAYTLEIKINE